MLTLLRNVDAYAPGPLGRVDLLLAGDRIAAVGPALPKAPVGWPCEEVDGSGLVAVPGLLDVHTHMSGGGGEGGAHTRVPPVALSAFTTAGVTTAVGLLGTDTSTRSMAELLACARGLEAYGLSAWCYTGGYPVPPLTLTGSARGDIVHVDRIIAIGETAVSDHRSTQPTWEELVRLAADAHVAGLMTRKAGLLHLHMGDGARGLAYVRRALDETELPARVFHPTHVNRNHRLWGEAKALTRRGVHVDITAGPPDDAGPGSAEALLDARAEGVPWDRLTLSSDGGGCLPRFDADGVLVHMGVGSSHSLLETLRALVAEGVPLSDALAPVTSTPARLFRFEDRGRLAPGLRADVLLLDEGLRVRALWAGGRPLVRDGVPVVRGLFEEGGPA
jgi:beta-aspartyl-dipeptidase (metallo-type)